MESDSSGFSNSTPNPSQHSLVTLSRNFLLAYQSIGVVYGDLSTSPLYVFTSVFKGRLHHYQNEEIIYGAFSLLFWTLTLLPLFKYCFIVLTADDNGEGGTFALYSLLCRHAKFNLLPNQQAADEELSAYKYGHSPQTVPTSPLKLFLDRHKKTRLALLVLVLFGAGMVIANGVLTPSISALSSVSGLSKKKITDGYVLLISCVILVSLFALQHCGTHRVAFLFPPIVCLWLFAIFGVGLYNIVHWNPKIVKALSPYYIFKFFKLTGKDGWISLGGILLCITGTEAMFADIGHFTALTIRSVFVFLVYPCLVIQYMGQAAFLSKNIKIVDNCFYDSIPESVYWPIFVVATLSAIVGSHAVITATFSIVKQCHALGCFPRVKIVNTSKHVYGQVYIPEINWILMFLTLAVTVGFRDATLVGNAYGLACVSGMVITSCLMTLVITFVWQKGLYAIPFLLLFGSLEVMYLSSAIMKVPEGGWAPIMLSIISMLIMCIWYYGTRKKYNFDLHNKVSLKWIIGLGPSLGIVRVPGIGLIYSELAMGVPAIFSHFVTNLPVFHKVLVFVCVKSVPVPFVSPEERFLVGRICPRPYRMYRCIVRYGYKDIRRDDSDFESLLIKSIAEFIQMESVEPQFSGAGSSPLDGRMAVISTSQSTQESSGLIVSEEDDPTNEDGTTIQSSKSLTLQSLRSVCEDETTVQIRRRRVKYELPQQSHATTDTSVREELIDLIEAKEAGVAYIMGLTYVKARRSSSFVKKLAIDIGYSFLRKNCRGPAVALNIPHISLIEVGMIYNV